MKTIAITGASGFIGKRLLHEHLKQGDHVRVLTRRPDLFLSAGANIEVCIGDLAARSISRDFPGDVDVLYHCAAEIKNPDLMYQVNVKGTGYLLEQACGRVGRWVQLSSAGVYGQYKCGEITESHELNPITQYETTKALSDQLIQEAGGSQGLQYSILRPTIVFGQGQSSQWLDALARLTKKGRFFFIGPEGAIANFVYVDDVVNALMLCAKHERAVGEIFNLSNSTTIEAFVETVAAVLGVDAPTARFPALPLTILAAATDWMPNNPLTRQRVSALTTRSVYPNKKICSYLGYRSHIALVEALRRTLLRKGRYGAA